MFSVKQIINGTAKFCTITALVIQVNLGSFLLFKMRRFVLFYRFPLSYSKDFIIITEMNMMRMKMRSGKEIIILPLLLHSNILHHRLQKPAFIFE